MSRPSSVTVPSVGDSKPAMTRSVVVLPQPDGPSKVRNSPGAMSRSMVSRPTIPPANSLRTDFSRNSASVIAANLRRLGGIDPKQFAACSAIVAEGMKQRALEGKAVALLELVGGAIHHQFHFARQH